MKKKDKIVIRFNPSIPKELLDRAKKAVKKYFEDNPVNKENGKRKKSN